MHPHRAHRRIAALTAVFALAAALPVSAGEATIVLVGFREGVPAEARAVLHTRLGASVLDAIPVLDVERVTVPLARPVALARYRADLSVAFAEPDGTGRLSLREANDLDRTAAESWRLDRANIPSAWARWPGRFYTADTKPRRAVKVAVLDGFIATDHRDFINRRGSSTNARRGGQIDLRDAADVVPADRQRGVLDWHGTFIAGLIGAAAHNGRGIPGAAYAAQLMPVVVADGDGAIRVSDAAAGIVHALDNGARVINASFAIPAGAGGLKTLRRAVVQAGRRGAVVVAAAGNDAGRATMYPAGFAADLRHVIAVSASNRMDTIASCSNYGPHITVAAPGTEILSLDPGGGTRQATCGTSAATALVSAVAAMIAARAPGMNPGAIRSRIVRGADDIHTRGPDQFSGAGRLNADRAIAARSPRIDAKRPKAAGATERTRLIADAASRRRIVAAEYSIGRPVPPGKGTRMRPKDGRWGERRERVKATRRTAKLEEGVHHVYVRAKDARGRWSAAALVPLVVDRVEPTVADVRTQPTVVAPGDRAATLHLSVGDALSRWMKVRIAFVDAAGVVQASHRYRLPSGTYSEPWRGTVDPPGGSSFDGPALPPGPYVIRVTAVDEAGHRTVGEGQTFVAPDTRSDP